VDFGAEERHTVSYIIVERSLELIDIFFRNSEVPLPVGIVPWMALLCRTHMMRRLYLYRQHKVWGRVERRGATCVDWEGARNHARILVTVAGRAGPSAFETLHWLLRRELRSWSGHCSNMCLPHSIVLFTFLGFLKSGTNRSFII